MKNSSHKNNFESNENIYGIGKNFLESKIKKYKKNFFIFLIFIYFFIFFISERY